VASVRYGAVLKPLRVLLHSGPMSGWSDGELIERFLETDTDAAELAFAAIVDRHGPMVRRVCRQMLGDFHDAQDVFQATFFILARKARSVRRRESLACWLHGTAYRACLRSRTAASRRRRRELAAASVASAVVSGSNRVDRSDVGDAIHEELAKLPERFRAPILLCDLEGVAYEEAARLLRCPVGTVKSRLARGRERLRARLQRRGIAPSTCLSAATCAKASVPSALREATARAAIRLTTGGTPTAGTVSTTVTTLMEGMIKSMIPFRLKTAAVLLGITSLGTGAGMVLSGTVQDEQKDSASRSVARPLAEAKPASPQANALPEGIISRIEFEGNTTITADKIKPKLLTRLGQPLDQDRIEADVKTLMGTKWFSDIRYFVAESPSKSAKWALTFVVREIPRWSKVELRGRKAISLKEIEYRTDLKAGNPAVPVRAKLAAQQILRLYVENDFDLASVNLLRGGKPGDTEVVVEIFEGPKCKLSSVSFVGNHFASAAQLRTTVAARRPIQDRAGGYHSDTLDDDHQKLVDYYQSQGFFEVRAIPVTRPGGNPGDVDLTFKISEGSRYKVRGVIIEGNTKIKTEELSEGLELLAGKPFIKAMQQADRDRMLIKYGEIGYIDAQITCEPQFTNQLGVVDLVYKIEEHTPSSRIPRNPVLNESAPRAK
jgi:RNA polymerase sigma factor (sigma-70 family)